MSGVDFECTYLEVALTRLLHQYHPSPCLPQYPCQLSSVTYSRNQSKVYGCYAQRMAAWKMVGQVHFVAVADFSAEPLAGPGLRLWQQLRLCYLAQAVEWHWTVWVLSGRELLRSAAGDRARSAKSDRNRRNLS